MKPWIHTRLHYAKLVDVLTLVVAWYFFGQVFQSIPTNTHSFVLWALISSLFSLFFWSAIGYSYHLLPKPEASSVVSLLFALPLSSILAKWVVLLTGNLPPIRYTEAVKAAICVSLVFELSQWILFKLQLAMGHKWCLVTHLDSEELALLKKQIEKSNSFSWINVRPLNGDALRGDETVVISRKSVRYLNQHPELLTAHLRGQRIVDMGQLLKEFRGRVSLDHCDGWTFLLASTYHRFSIRVYSYVKQIIEVLLAAVLLVLLTPLWLAVAVGVYVTEGRPILYRQLRLGHRARQFYLYKFRTMPLAAEEDGPRWASENDPRVCKFGRWLRKTHVDELPQLLNVLRGDLSFVGPRPERPEFYTILNGHIPLFSTRLSVRPGITGWAQVRQGYAASVEECKTKLEYDLYYVQNMSPGLDVHIVLSTAGMMIRGSSSRFDSCA